MFQKIMVAFDGSTSSNVALRQAIELTRLMRSELHLFGVIVNSGGMAIGQAAGAEDVLGREGEMIRAQLAAVSEPLRAEGLNVMVDAVEGQPAAAIAHYARQIKTDLLVIGHIPQFSLGHWLQGSVAKALLRELPCSILVAK